MPVSPELLELLVCPETRQPVRPAPPELLERVNTAIREGRVRNRGGTLLRDPLEEALVREDGRVLYPVEDGIPAMLVEESIELSD